MPIVGEYLEERSKLQEIHPPEQHPNNFYTRITLNHLAIFTDHRGLAGVVGSVGGVWIGGII
jgi:hypothetical protein